MIKTKIAYVCALALSLSLILLSDKYPFAVLFALLVAIPLLGLAELALTYPFFRISGRLKNDIIDENNENRFIIEIRSLLPVFSGEIHLSLKNCLTEETLSEKIGFCALPVKKKKIVLKPLPDHCGIVEIALKKATVRDFASLFKFTVRPKTSFKEFVLPKLIPQDLPRLLSKTNINLDEDIFSEEKSGDDPSEVFGIREYRQGDRLRQIHQKLSAKRDKLISKEYSLPIDKDITLLCAPYFDTLKNTDTEVFYDRVYSVSSELIKNKIKHTIVFKSLSGTSSFRVESETDVKDMARLLITLKPAAAPPVSAGSNTIYIDGRT